MTEVRTDAVVRERTGRLRPVGVVLLAAGAALAVWAATRAGGVDLAARTGDSARAVGPVTVAVTAVLAGLAGWGLLAVLERVLRRPNLVWRTVAVVVFVVSLTGPLAGVGTGAKLALAGMHLAVAAVLVAGLPRSPARGDVRGR